jgi:parallel beta-helix repeat protein
MKSFSGAFFIAMVFALVLVSVAHFGTVQASTSVTGEITSNTGWTKANSPYILTGQVTVKSGVTLTIMAGVTVDLGNYSLQIDGTLYARGSNEEKITFLPNMNKLSLWRITFTSSSSSWNSQTGTGCIIENTNLSNNSIYITDSSPKINNVTVDFCVDAVEIVVDGGSATISNSNITGGINVERGSPIIANNTLTNFPGHTCGIVVDGGAPQTINNTIAGEQGNIRVFDGSPTIANNTISNGGIQDTFNHYDVISIGGAGTSIISNNTIIASSSKYDGIYFGEDSQAFISGNVISGCQSGISIGLGSATIEKNYLIDNYKGITVWDNASLVIRNNTITRNSVGISLEMPSSTTINYNNLYNNTNYNIQLSPSPLWLRDIDATNNWWGAADTQAINQTIYDHKNDINIGTVTFEPFLTAPNPAAQPAIPEFPSWTILAIVVIVTTLLALTHFKKVNGKLKVNLKSVFRFCE